MSDYNSPLVPSRPPGLVDVLDRILDKGLVIVGDVKISLAEVELLTLKIRLLVCSVDKAEQIGINWWRHDPDLMVPADGRSDGNHATEACPVLPESAAQAESSDAGLSAGTNGKSGAARKSGGKKRGARSA